MAKREIEVFQVFYDGPALETCDANTIELVAALVAVTDLFTAVMAAVQGMTKPLRVEVHRGVKAGYFGVKFLHIEEDTPITRLAPKASSDLAPVSVLRLLAAPMSGLIWFLRHLRGRPLPEIDAAGQLSTDWITDPQFERVNEQTLAMWRCPKVRTSLAATLSPLRDGGYTSFNIMRDRNVWLQIRANEVDTFNA